MQDRVSNLGGEQAAAFGGTPGAVVSAVLAAATAEPRAKRKSRGRVATLKAAEAAVSRGVSHSETATGRHIGGADPTTAAGEVGSPGTDRPTLGNDEHVGAAGAGSGGRFIREFRAAGLRPEQIWCDASDKEMADLLAEAGWSVNRKNFGAPAYNDEIYLSWGAEAWHETANAIERCEIILPDDEKLKAQLTTRMKSINARGKLCLEDKHAMRKRNLSSPDRADAICGVLAVREMAAVQYFGRIPMGFGAQLDEAMNTGGVLAGAEAGW